MTQTFYLLIILHACMINSIVIGMDTYTNKHMPKHSLYGKLLIDAEEYYLLKPLHSNKKIAVAYIIQKHREEYPYAQAFKKIPLRNPFVHIKIIPNDAPATKILTIIPAQKLINCSDGSQLDIVSPDCTLHLTCAINNNLVINKKYFSQDKKGTSFEGQFLSCMNQFYTRPNYCIAISDRQELVRHRVIKPLSVTASTSPTGRFTFTLTTFDSHSHGVEGCSSEKHLIDLATNIKTRRDNYSKFNYVTRRELNSKPQPKYKGIIDPDLLLGQCLTQMAYDYSAQEKILNESINEFIVIPFLANICINNLLMRTFTQFIIAQQSHKK